jgi:ribosomal protein L37AE/L43A
MSEARTATQYCPYCGETNLWPHEASHGAWECRDCGRVFSVSFLGLSGRAVSVGSSAVGSTVEAPAKAGSQTGEES